MTGTAYWCKSCVMPRAAGEVLLVTPADGSLTFHVCRPFIRPSCLKSAGRRDQTAISTLDPDAAREYDRGQGGDQLTVVKVEDRFLAAAPALAERLAEIKSVPSWERTRRTA